MSYDLFAGSNYYPAGGWQDHYGTFDTIEEAKAVIERQHTFKYGLRSGYTQPGWAFTGRYDWAHIVHYRSIIATYTSNTYIDDEGVPRWGTDNEASHTPIWVEVTE